MEEAAISEEWEQDEMYNTSTWWWAAQPFTYWLYYENMPLFISTYSFTSFSLKRFFRSTQSNLWLQLWDHVYNKLTKEMSDETKVALLAGNRTAFSEPAYYEK